MHTRVHTGRFTFSLVVETPSNVPEWGVSNVMMSVVGNSGGRSLPPKNAVKNLKRSATHPSKTPPTSPEKKRAHIETSSKSQASQSSPISKLSSDGTFISSPLAPEVNAFTLLGKKEVCLLFCSCSFFYSYIP